MNLVHLLQQKGRTLHPCLGLLLDRPPSVQIKADLLLHPLVLCFTASGDKRRFKVLRPHFPLRHCQQGSFFRSNLCLAEAK